MAKMNLTLAGTTFTDYLLANVGSGAFRLEHDYFTKQDLVIRTAASGGGTLLVEDIDYTLGGEDLYLSAQVTAAVGSGRNVFLTVTIINATYQTGSLYFSGKYVADAVEAGDVDRIGYSTKSANFTVRRDDCTRTYLVTTGSGSDITASLPTCDGTNGRIRFVKMDTGTAKLIVDGYSTEKIGVEGNALTFELYERGDWVEIEDVGTLWDVVSTNGPEMRYVSTSNVAIGTPAAATWYNPSGHSLTLPAGVWELAYEVVAAMTVASSAEISYQVRATLSTANNSASDSQLTSLALSVTKITGAILVALTSTFARRKRLELATATTYYLNLYASYDSGSSLSLTTVGATGATVIMARRVG